MATELARDVMEEEEWLTAEQAAQWLHVSRWTVERACREHRLPAIQMKKKWLISKSGLIEQAKANVRSQESTGREDEPQSE